MELGYRLFLEDERRKLEEEKDKLLRMLGDLATHTEDEILEMLEEVQIKLAVLRKELEKLDGA
jgi:hypothetical protein